MAEKLRHKEHHFSCPKTQAWDIDNVPCSCPRGWPRTPHAMPLPADVSAQEIAALRAKLEQAQVDLVKAQNQGAELHDKLEQAEADFKQMAALESVGDAQTTSSADESRDTTVTGT